jgi:hypothetical protein
MELIKKLRALNVMVEELATAADDRFSDLQALGDAVRKLSSGKDTTVSRLGAISQCLAQDGTGEVLGLIEEIRARIDDLVKQAEVACG